MKDDDYDDDWMEKMGLEIVSGNASSITPEMMTEMLAMPNRKIVGYDRETGDILLDCGHRIEGSEDASQGENQDGEDILEVLLEEGGIAWKCQECYRLGMGRAEKMLDR